jgi:hypothetical protein
MYGYITGHVARTVMQFAVADIIEYVSLTIANLFEKAPMSYDCPLL